MLWPSNSLAYSEKGGVMELHVEGWERAPFSPTMEGSLRECGWLQKGWGCWGRGGQRLQAPSTFIVTFLEALGLLWSLQNVD